MKHSRKAENSVATLILFIAVMALATTATVIFKNIMDQSQSAVQSQQKQQVNVIGTSFTIALVSYDEINTTTAYVKNTGKTRFDTEDLDIYINGGRIYRNVSNRTITVAADTDDVNIGVWDPGEELEVQVFEVLTPDQTNEFVLAAPNGVTAEEEFSS